MVGNSSASNFGTDRGGPNPQNFLASHRALGACTREFTRLSDEIVNGLADLANTIGMEKAVIRQSPGRCIVQLGPVALTMAWLQSSLNSVPSGELLVILWRGSVAPKQRREPERALVGPAPVPATPLWEQVLTAVADSEATWAWRPNDTLRADWSSTELAAACVERLRDAYLDAVPAAQST